MPTSVPAAPSSISNRSPLARRFVRYLWREWIRPLAIPVLLVTSAKSAFADINYVPTGSMQPTILPGDVLFIDKLAYDLRVPFTFTRIAQWADPARGDIVVCFSPDTDTRLVKRVIGLPGDTIELRDDVLIINAARQSYSTLDPLTDHGASHLPAASRDAARFAREQLDGRPHAVMVTPGRPAVRNFGPVTVPPDRYLVLGDHRDNSHDSRFFGFVPRHAIIGEAKAVVASADLDRWLRPRLDRFFTAIE